jgi:hypothetical protein
MSTSRMRVRTGALSVITATALAAALAAVPAGAANGSTAVASAASHTSSLRSTQHGTQRPTVVTLLTGDRVLVRHDATGRTIASLTPRSPHYGRPVQFVNTGTHTWVIPKLAPAALTHFDASVFDVAALARTSRVPLKVTFAKGTAPRNLPGLQMRTSSARSSAGGRTTVAASYDARRPLPASFASSLRGVSRISLAGAVPQVDPAYELHTLTIDATNVKGNPLRFGETFVINMDDARLFGTFGFLLDGQWKVSVPSGHYLLVTDNFRRMVVSQVDVADDTAVPVPLASATVRPRSVYPGFKSVGSELDLVGSDASGHGGFSFGFGGFFPRLSPISHVDAGTLTTEVGNQWSTRHYRPFEFTHHRVIVHPIKFVASAKEVRSGIPNKLSFSYRPSDFAKVDIRHHSTGQKTDSFDGWGAFSPLDQFLFISGFPSVRPGIIHAQFQASRDLRWLSFTDASTSFRSFTELDDISQYRRARHGKIEFFRGPLTPVADRGSESKGTGVFCSLCVHAGVLHGFLAMMSSAGTTQRGFSTAGRWAIGHGRTLDDHGKVAIDPVVKDVTPGQKMVLFAGTGKATKGWQLSTQVLDRWKFSVPSGNAVVPILRAAYVPPTNLHSVGKAGHVSFPVTFDNLGPVDAKVAKAALKWSVDGQHWHAAHLKRTDKNTFRASYVNPVGTSAHPYLSLKVTAHDAAGRSISESVEHAYLLPRGKAHASTSDHASHRASHRAGHRDRFRPSKLCRTSGKHSYSCFVKLNAATRDLGKASPDPGGWGAPALHSAYDLGDDQNPGTVAVIVAFDYPHAEADMNHYRAQFGLPACTSASGCFTKINQKGETGNYPEQDFGWGVEASLDLQMISTACNTCNIILVEANQPSDKALFHAEQAAVDAGATVTNHSFGRLELTGAESDALHFDHPGVTAVASTGDFGYGPASFPASAPNVIAVGGTSLSRSRVDVRGWTEKAWRFAGSGCSAYFEKPAGQDDTACHGRTLADVSAVARGLAIYNTSLPRRFRGWLEVDGTSASSPLIAGMIGSVGTPGVTPPLLYAHAADLNDVVGGSNGFCQGSYMCTGVAGYDGPTGLGSPNGVSAFAVP